MIELTVCIVSKNTMPLTSVTSQLLCNQNIGRNLDMVRGCVATGLEN